MDKDWVAGRIDNNILWIYSYFFSRLHHNPMDLFWIRIRSQCCVSRCSIWIIRSNIYELLMSLMIKKCLKLKKNWFCRTLDVIDSHCNKKLYFLGRNKLILQEQFIAFSKALNCPWFEAFLGGNVVHFLVNKEQNLILHPFIREISKKEILIDTRTRSSVSPSSRRGHKVDKWNPNRRNSSLY